MYLIIKTMIRKLPCLLMPFFIVVFIGCNNNPEPAKSIVATEANHTHYGLVELE